MLVSSLRSHTNKWPGMRGLNQITTCQSSASSPMRASGMPCIKTERKCTTGASASTAHNTDSNYSLHISSSGTPLQTSTHSSSALAAPSTTLHFHSPTHVFQLHQHRDYSDCVYVLLLHHPMTPQLEKLERMRKHARDWKETLQNLSKPTR